jgi:DNA-binding LacI/PurR family transcriptional regulator/DNA-binding transcriptional regulator YhcF (GntR family)
MPFSQAQGGGRMEKKAESHAGRKAQYREIAQKFARSINSGAWPEGAPVPSLSQLANSLGVGKRTIRLALACLAREQRIAKNARRKWVVRNAEQAFSFQSPCIALIANKFLGEYWAAEPMMIRKGIEMAIMEHWEKRSRQLRFYFRNMSNNQKINRSIVPGIKDAELHGILLLGHFTKTCLQQYAALGLPVVRVDAPAGIPRLASVCIDNAAAAKDTVLRMAQLGHRRIAFCRSVLIHTTEIDPDSMERQAGFLAGLKECGIPNGPSHIYNFLHTSAPVKLSAIFKARPRYTAVLCVDLPIAQIIESEALKTGLVLPRDLSLAGFAAQGVMPKYSGPRANFEQIGREAAELLESRAVRQIRIPSIWHDGSTIGPAPAAKY